MLLQEEAFMLIKNMVLIVGIFSSLSTVFAKTEGEKILDRIAREQAAGDYNWEPSGFTAENIRAATRINNLAVPGSREDELIRAVQKGDCEDVQRLIAAGADLEARNTENMTSLMIAVQKGYTDIARQLITAGADIKAKGRYGETVLFYAVDNDHCEIVQLLIEHDAAKDEKNCSFSMKFEYFFVESICKGNNEMVKALMAKLDHIDYDTLKTADSFARDTCSAEIVCAIKEALSRFSSSTAH